MPHARRHGRSSGSRSAHRSATASTGRHRRLWVLAAVAAGGLAVAFWLPARNDSASADEIGPGASAGQYQNWSHFWGGGRRNRPPHFPFPSGPSGFPFPSAPSGFPTPSQLPSDPPTVEPTSEAPTDEPPASSFPPPSTEPTTTAPTTEPTSEPPTTPPTTAPAKIKWAAYTDYEAGQIVTYKGKDYEVLADHTSLPGWEPPAVPALFELVD